jgi:hypothetical protein
VSVTSIEQYSGAIEAVAANSAQSWYRGIGSVDFNLAPGLYRPRSPGDIPDLDDSLRREAELFKQFKVRSLPFIGESLKPWELMFLMQHHRVPTRLLDWSEDPFAALFFSLESAELHQFADDAAVWVLDPVSWNDHVFAKASPPGAPLVVDDRKLEPYATPPDVEMLREHPVALLAPHSNSRLVAQQGTFCVFGNSLEPMEVLHGRLNFPSDALQRIDIDKGAAQRMLASLLRMGYRRSRLFPDLDGLASELRRHVGFTP